jgi:hypothetical protein
MDNNRRKQNQNQNQNQNKNQNQIKKFNNITTTIILFS